MTGVGEGWGGGSGGLEVVGKGGPPAHLEQFPLAIVHFNCKCDVHMFAMKNFMDVFVIGTRQ